MKDHRVTTICTYALLAGVAGASFLMTESLSIPQTHATTPVDTVQMRGTVRDFLRAHTDFDLTHGTETGHAGGVVATTLASNGDPSFLGASGGGFAVGDQWRDESGNNVPPHLVSGAADTVRVQNSPKFKNSASADTWDSSDGTYGDGPIGGAPTWETGSTMPTVDVPTGLTFTDTLSFGGSGTSTLNYSRHVNNFFVDDRHKVRVSGDVVLVVEDEFRITGSNSDDDSSSGGVDAGGGWLEILDGSSLTVYVLGDGLVEGNAVVNVARDGGDDGSSDSSSGTGYSSGEPDDPSKLTIYIDGNKDFIVQDYGEVSAHLVAPDAQLYMTDRSHFYGTYTGKRAWLENYAEYHHDIAGGNAVCGSELADQKGTSTGSSNGAVTSTASFGEWFADTLGVNSGGAYTMVLTSVGSGVYEFNSTEFFPIDGMLLGDEGDPNNRNFTVEVQADFVYNACTGQYFEIQGGDGCWLFVDGQLGIDLGGFKVTDTQHLAIDRLSLTDGETYTVKLFVAQRNPDGSSFRIRTNIDLITPEDGVVSGVFD